MDENKAAKPATPESTRRYRMAMAALKNLEASDDRTFAVFLAEYGAIFELYVAAKQREIEARDPKAEQEKADEYQSIGPTTSVGAALRKFSNIVAK